MLHPLVEFQSTGLDYSQAEDDALEDPSCGGAASSELLAPHTHLQHLLGDADISSAAVGATTHLQRPGDSAMSQAPRSSGHSQYQ